MALRVSTLLVTVLLIGAAASAQPASPAAMTVEGAIDAALRQHPAVVEAQARANAAQAAVSVARTAFLPRLDMLWQINRATRNNVFGLLLPQSVVPPISGPVLGTSSYDSVWGAAGGMLLSWDAVDFGLRKAQVDAAKAQTEAGIAQRDLVALDVAAAAADAFLTVLAADEGVRAAGANVARLQVFGESVRALVQNQLRPGADESRANAELALARNQLSQATAAAAVARATLAVAIGDAGASITIDSYGLARLPDPTTVAGDVTRHPAARVEAATIETIRARERAVARSVFPRVSVQSAWFGRGSAELPGQSMPGNGLMFQVPNWAAGLTVTFPAFESFTANAKKRLEEQNASAQQARYRRTVEDLTAQQVRARALMTAAVEVARNTPIALTAAAEAESRARIRYASGLTSVTEVAEAQRLLAQAEADAAVARLGVWRALLASAQTRGDLSIFLENLRRP